MPMTGRRYTRVATQARHASTCFYGETDSNASSFNLDKTAARPITSLGGVPAEERTDY